MPRSARLNSGWSMSLCSAPYSAAVMPRREHRRIESRQADEREHVAVVRIERDHRAAMAGERLFGDALHLEIDRQHQFVPGRGRAACAARGTNAPWRSHRASLGVDQHLAEAVVPCSCALEGALDAELADQRGAGVGGAIDVLEILLADRAHVAERVHREVAVRIPARLARLDVDAPGTRSGARRSAPRPRPTCAAGSARCRSCGSSRWCARSRRRPRRGSDPAAPGASSVLSMSGTSSGTSSSW